MIRLFHLTTEAAFLKLAKSAWIAAETPERAVVIWVMNLLGFEGTPGPGDISVYAYEPESEGFVSLEADRYRVAFVKESERELIAHDWREWERERRNLR